MVASVTWGLRAESQWDLGACGKKEEEGEEEKEREEEGERKEEREEREGGKRKKHHEAFNTSKC